MKKINHLTKCRRTTSCLKQQHFHVIKVISFWWHIESDREIEIFFSLWEYRFSFSPFPPNLTLFHLSPATGNDDFKHQHWYTNGTISMSSKELQMVHISFTGGIRNWSEATTWHSGYMYTFWNRTGFKPTSATYADETVYKLFCLSGPPFPHLETRDKNSTHLIGWFWKSNEMQHAKHLAQYLACNSW